MIKRAEITIMLHDPDGNILVNKVIPVDWQDWRDNGLYPLPQGHDSPLDSSAYKFGQEMIEKRCAYLNRLMRSLYDIFAEGIYAQDPRIGYSRKKMK